MISNRKEILLSLCILCIVAFGMAQTVSAQGIGSDAVAGHGATAASTLGGLAKTIVSLLNTASILLISATLAIYMFGAFRQVYDISQGKVKGANLSNYFLKGLGVLFVMVSIWGIVQIVQYTFLGGPSPENTEGVLPYTRIP